MIFLLIQLIFVTFIFFLTLAFLTGAPFVPSNKKTSETMVKLANITKKSIVYDLGSGDGRLLFCAHTHNAKKVIGIEINFFLVLYTKIKIFFAQQKGVYVWWGNFWNTSLSDATVVFVYLLPWKMEALAHKLKKELKPGTIIVSNSFIFPSWNVVREDKEHHVYVFKL